jgi:hypothetical protein
MVFEPKQEHFRQRGQLPSAQIVQVKAVRLESLHTVRLNLRFAHGLEA